MIAFLAWLLRAVFRYRSDVVMVNLSRSFPEKKYAELQEIHKKFYRHFVTIFVEMLRFGRYRGEKGRRRLHESHLVEFTNPEEYNRLAAGATQVMLLQSHAGNWELSIGIFYYSYGKKLDMDPSRYAVTYLRLSSAWADRFMARNRTAPVSDLDFKGYVESFDMRAFAKEREGQKFCYSFITDQYPYNGNLNTRVRFMNQETPTMKGGASMAVKQDMAVAYLRFRCREGGGYTMTVVPICDRAAGKDPAWIMQRYYELLEEDLRAQPWNYLWTHKRWK